MRIRPRSLEEKSAWMRERVQQREQAKNTASEGARFLTVSQAAKELGLSRSGAYRILTVEPGVYRIFLPGSKRPVMRVEPEIVDRILKRSIVR